MRGVSKKRDRSCVTYEFELPVVLPELVRLRWAAEEDIAALLLVAATV